MKKILAASLIILLSLKAEKSSCQQYLGFDAIANMALCKDSTCFRKAAEKAGFVFLQTQATPNHDGYFTVYLQKKKEADGSVNRLSWIFYNKKEGISKYVDFTTTSSKAFTELAATADNRGFIYLKNQSRTDDKGRLMMSFYYKKSYTGLQVVVSKTDTQKGEAELYSFSIKIPAGPNWPDEY